MPKQEQNTIGPDSSGGPFKVKRDDHWNDSTQRKDNGEGDAEGTGNRGKAMDLDGGLDGYKTASEGGKNKFKTDGKSKPAFD